MMRASKTTALIQSQNVPFFKHARELASGGTVPGGTKENAAFTESSTGYSSGIPQSVRYLMNDAQTSGGLLISLAEDKAEGFIQRMNEVGKPAWLIGSVADRGEKFIQVS
jgi:selenophosphate synthase